MIPNAWKGFNFDLGDQRARYDALISAQFGWPSPTSFSGRIALDGKPIVELDIQPSLPNFAREAAARSFVLAHTPPAFPPPPAPKPAD